MNKVHWAEHTLRDEYFQEMMEELRGVELNKIAMSEYDQVNVRENAYMTLRALENVENYLNGLVAQKIIEEKRIKIL
jgi:hypothetical protein